MHEIRAVSRYCKFKITFSCTHRDRAASFLIEIMQKPLFYYWTVYLLPWLTSILLSAASVETLVMADCTEQYWHLIPWHNDFQNPKYMGSGIQEEAAL